MVRTASRLTVTDPSGGVNLRELDTRLRMTCANLASSTLIEYLLNTRVVSMSHTSSSFTLASRAFSNSSNNDVDEDEDGDGEKCDGLTLHLHYY